MAIKGKGRTRSKQVTRGPKPAAVPVRPPFFLRRPVQVALAFVSGVGLVAFLVWFTNGLQAERERNAQAEAAGEREAIVRQYQSRIQAVLQPIGRPEPPLGFTAFPELSSGLDDLAGDDAPPEELVGTARNAIEAAERAVEQLEAMDLDDLIRDKGFPQHVVNYVLNSRRRMVQGLQLYREAARAVTEAAAAEDGARGDLVGLATRVAATAGEVFQDGYLDYQQVLASANIFPVPEVPGPGDLGGGS